MCEQTVATLPAPLPADEVDAAQQRLAESDRAVERGAVRRSPGWHSREQGGRSSGGRCRPADGARRRPGEPAVRTARGVRAAVRADGGHDSRLRAEAGSDDGGIDGTPVSGSHGDLVAGAIAEVGGAQPGAASDRPGSGAGRRGGAAGSRAARAAQAARPRRRNAIGCRDGTAARPRPLVELGAPSADGLGLAAGWATLSALGRRAGSGRGGRLRQAKEAAARAVGERTRLTAVFDDAERALARLRAVAKAASDDDQRARARLGQVTARITELGELLAGAPGDGQITEGLALRDRLESAAAAAEMALRAARAGRGHWRGCPDSHGGAERTARRQLSAARDRVVALGAPAMDGQGLLDGWTELVTWASGEVKLREQEADAATAEADAARDSIGELTGKLAADLAGAGIDLPPQSLATSAAAAVTGALAQANATTRRIAERREQAAGLVGRQQSAQEEQQVAHLLGNLLQARQFPQWLVSEALDDLVAVASQTLAALSSGQFDLTHEKGDLFVIDHADADARRSVRTLSGGETFQASLALALALSSQISSLAAAGAARLDSIFLDEGFGTLDAETLEVVASTLETLAQGDRMVGVVTHVAELAERVPVRFRVVRNARTSTVVREGLSAAETGLTTDAGLS